MIVEAMKAKPRLHLTEQVLISVLLQESGDFKSTFVKTDEQYRKNMSAAIKGLGKTEAEVLKLVTRSDGQIAKFRFELGTYISPKFKNVNPTDRFYLSTSWGISQTMGYNIVGKQTKNIPSLCLAFAANEAYSILFAAGSMDTGMTRAFNSPAVLKKDLKSLAYHGYSCYNSGSVIPKNPSVAKKCQEVVSRL